MPATEEMLANPIHQGGFNNLIVPATPQQRGWGPGL